MAQRSALVRWGLAALLGVVLCNCRATNQTDDGTALLGDAVTAWYDAAGNGGTCDPPAKACSGYKDEKTFVDQCVAKGFQAKTCGCSLRCSGRIEPPATTAATTGTAARAPASGQDTRKGCDADARSFIEATAAARKPGTALDRCIDSHVCNGNLGWCSPEERQTTTRLRALARQGCESDVLGTVCKEGYLDSLGCPEEDIRKLSRTWAEFANKDSAQKRCIRNSVCSDDKNGCTAEGLKQGQAIKASVDRDGCEYWLRAFCSLGTKSW